MKNKKPNIIYILNDHQVNYGHGSQGVRIKRPVFDKFASEGVRFERAYSVCPLCGPARRSMLTGLIMENLLMMQIIPLIRRFIWIHYMRKVMIITTLESGMPGRELHWNIIVRALIIQAIIIHITNQNIKSISEGKNFRNPEF